MKVTSKLATFGLTTGLAVVGIVGVAGPALAAPGDTPATFAITGGDLGITVPTGTVALVTGTVNTGAATAVGQLGNVTVADGRGALDNSWTATVSTTDFVTGSTPTAAETVLANKIDYSSGVATAHSGLGTFVPGAAPSYTGDSGISSTTWNPTLTFNLLPQQVVGTYSGTVTHSVA